MSEGPVIIVDADACPVKNEIERLAAKRGVKVIHVCGLELLNREGEGVEVVYVESGPDAADEWIIEHCHEGDIVVALDVPLASEAIKHGARVVDFRGREMTERNMPDRLQMRNLMTAIREQGDQTRGPRPLTKRDRVNFTTTLARMLDQALKK